MDTISIPGRTSPPLASPTAIIHNATSSEESLTSIANGSVDLPPLRDDLVEKAIALANARYVLEIIQHPDRGHAFDPHDGAMWSSAIPVVPATLAELQLRYEGQSFAFDASDFICSLEVMKVEGDTLQKSEVYECQTKHTTVRPVHVDVHENGTAPTIFAFDQVQVPDLGHYRFRLSLRRLPTETAHMDTQPIDDGLICPQAVSNVFEVIPLKDFEAGYDIMTAMSRQMFRAVRGFYQPAEYRLPEHTNNINDEPMNG